MRLNRQIIQLRADDPSLQGLDYKYIIDVIFNHSESIIEINQTIITFCRPIITILESTEFNSEVKSENANLFLNNIDDELIQLIDSIYSWTSYWEKITFPKGRNVFIDETKETYFLIHKSTMSARQSLERISKFKIS